MLRPATALDWVGDPFDTTGFVALHGESTYAQFLDHYREYTDVAGDHFLNLVATTLPTNAFLLTGEAKYRRWIVDYMDAWLARMKQNDGIIPSFVDVDGTIGGPARRWWGNAYGWGFSPINPVTGRRENRNRIPRALVGFSNALLVTGDEKYVDAWRAMIAAVNAHSRIVEGRTEYPTMAGADGWYGWQRAAVERRRARGVVLVDAPGGSRARGRKSLARLSRRDECRLPRDSSARRHRQHPGQARDHPRGSVRRRTSAWPTTCSTPTRPRPTRWCG